MLKNKNLTRVIAIFAMLVMSSVMLAGCEIKKNSNNAQTASYEQPVDNFINGLAEANSEKFKKAFPDFMADYMGKIFTDEYLKATLDKAEEVYGENIKMEYSIKDKNELQESDLKNMENSVKSSFDKEIKITKGYDLTLELTTKGDITGDVEEEIISVYEIDGNWYLLNI